MTELSGFAAAVDWLPPGVIRAQAIEDQAERREARRAEAARQERADGMAESGLAAYKAAAEGRGETVGAMAMATGEVPGRGLEDIFGAAVAAADREDARSAARESREDKHFVDSDVVLHGASRSDGWPGSSYELSRMIDQAQDLRRWMTMYEARLASRQGRGAEHIEALRAKAERGHASRSGQGAYTEITRVCTPDGNVAWR
jgi:hypothetical protein